MADKPAPGEKSSISADWFMRGALTRIGDAFDRLTGRKWTPSSSIATSELVERLKKLLDAEKKEVPGKGFVVPHNIKLKVQWDKFSTDSEQTIERVQNELTVAAADYINDNLYYTLAPLHLEIKSDYFTDGVKLYSSFGELKEDQGDAELNVTVPAFTLQQAGIQLDPLKSAPFELSVIFTTAGGRQFDRRLEVTPGKPISIGRMGGNALMIDDPSISKTHASLTVDAEGNMTVADTASTNGTFVNGERIAYGKAVPVGAEDKLKVGSVKLAMELRRREISVEEEAAEEEEAMVSPEGLEFKIRSNAGDRSETPEQHTETAVETGSEETTGTTKTAVLPIPESSGIDLKTPIIIDPEELAEHTRTSVDVKPEAPAKTEPEEKESPAHD